MDVGIPYPNSDTMDPTVGYGGITFGDHPWGINETDAIGLFWGVKSLKMNFEVHVICLQGAERLAVYGGYSWGVSWVVHYFDCVCQVLSRFFNGGRRLCCFQ